MTVIFPFICRLFHVYEPRVCHFIDREVSLGNVSPLLDASHPACEIIRGDTQQLRSNFLWVYNVYLLNFGSNKFYKEKSYLNQFWFSFNILLPFSFSYALLIMLNRLGLFTILPTHDDENRVMCFNRACCFKYLNRINPSFAMS